MKKVIFAILAGGLLMFSCGGNNRTGQRQEVPVDSVEVTDTVEVETEEEQLIEETPMPKAADELFDDFIFNFAANHKLQLARIEFPLQVVADGHTSRIAKKQWKMDYFFMRQGYYTLLFNSREEMDVVKDTSVGHVTLEKIYLDQDLIKQYEFNRINGLWVLQKMVSLPIEESENASFLTFYKQFATDSTFQVQSLCNPVQFVGPDPDDDFGQMEGVITDDTWSAFAPELPSQMIYNVVYGAPGKETHHKIFVLRGIANGMELELVFRRVGGKWLLEKLTT